MRSPSLLRALTLALVGLVIAAPFAPASSAVAVEESTIDRAIDDCLDLTPRETSMNGITDDGHEITLEVHVLLDGVELDHGRGNMEAAARAYGEIGIKLVSTFEEVSIPPTTTGPPPTLDTGDAFAWAENHFGGFRPHGTDVVYIMTAQDLVNGGATGGSVAGQADCIGGVQYPDEAFATGEVSERDPSDDHWYGSVVAAHEIGHLLGAHHHYTNCAQGEPEDIIEYWTPCTLMFPTVTFISRRFSTVEAAAVRGYALAFADKTPVGVPAAAERSIDLEIKRRVLDGMVSSDIQTCSSEVEVILEKRARQVWSEKSRKTADANGQFSFELAKTETGNFRALVGEMTVHDGDNWRTCAALASDSIKVKAKTKS